MKHESRPPWTPYKAWAYATGDVKHPSLSDPQWWLLGPSGTWSNWFGENRFWLFAADLEIASERDSDPEAVEIIKKAKLTHLCQTSN